MRSFLPLLAVAVVLCSSRAAHASYELGSSPTFGVNREWGSSSLGVGLGLSVQHTRDQFLNGPGLFLADVTVLRLYPAVVYRRYWGESDVQPYLAVRVGKDLAFAFADDEAADPYLDALEDGNDPFRSFVGMGLRTFLTERLALAGEVGPDVQVQRINGEYRSTFVATRFIILLQYHP